MQFKPCAWARRALLDQPGADARVAPVQERFERPSIAPLVVFAEIRVVEEGRAAGREDAAAFRKVRVDGGDVGVDERIKAEAKSTASLSIERNILPSLTRY